MLLSMHLKALNPRIPWRIWRNGPGSVKKPNQPPSNYFIGICSFRRAHGFFFRTHQPSSHGKILKPRVTPCWRLFIRVITPLLVGARLANEFPPTKTRLKVNDSLRSIYARHYKNMSSKEHRASWRRELVVELLGAWVMSSWWWSWVYLLEYTHYINTFRPLSSLDIRGW